MRRLPLQHIDPVMQLEHKYSHVLDEIQLTSISLLLISPVNSVRTLLITYFSLEQCTECNSSKGHTKV